MKQRNKQVVVILFVCLVAVIIHSAVRGLVKTNSYIAENGRKNMETVIGQMRQSYDVQIREYYIDLQQIDEHLFRKESRSIRLSDYADFFDARKKNAYDRLLFIKENGEVLTEDGERNCVTISQHSLSNLCNNRSTDELVSWTEDGKQTHSYLVAIPSQAYYVDGERFDAIGALYEHARIDAMLEMSGYRGYGYLFLVDGHGVVTYTNQPQSAFLQDYALLDHLRSENAITQKDYNYIAEKFTDTSNAQEVLLLSCEGKHYYFGYAPLQESNNMLICIVPEAAVNNVLMEYRRDMMIVSFFMTGLTIALCCGLLWFVFKLRETEHKMAYEEQNHQMQFQAIEALRVEKSRVELANQAKSQFLSRMSHDIRTPMNAIVCTLELMEREADAPDKIRDYAKKGKASCQQLLSLVNNVLDMSQMEYTEVVLSRDAVSMANQLDRLESMVWPQILEKEQHFEVHTHNITHEYLVGDAARLQQILLNLLSNAIKFTPAGGSISLELDEKPSSQPGMAQFAFTISDTGCGMTPDFVKRVFDPFARAEDSMTSKNQGTGLGLAITKSLVDMMGGTIVAESELGAGSTFTATVSLEIDSSAKYDISAKSVLLVTTNAQLIADVRSVLQGAGLRFAATSTAVQTEKLLKENQPDVIIMTGYSSDPDFDGAVRRMRMHSHNCPLIFCYEYRRMGQRKKMFPHSNIDGVMTGPFFFDTFASLVNQARGDVGQEEENNSIAGMKFLCAEDNPSNVEVLTAMLELEGASCDVYANGVELVKAFASVKPGEYVAILTDVQMPVMNGLEATRAIRGGKNPLGKTIPIIAMTANVFTSDVRDCLEAGMTAHLPKPLDMKMLKRTLYAALYADTEGEGKTV